MTETITTNGVQEAADKAGGVIPLAHMLGVTHQAVYGWIKRAWMPARQAVIVEQKLGINRALTIDPHMLDLFAMPADDYLAKHAKGGND